MDLINGWNTTFPRHFTQHALAHGKDVWCDRCNEVRIADQHLERVRLDPQVLRTPGACLAVAQCPSQSGNTVSGAQGHAHTAPRHGRRLGH
jgi:hypothetical protein